MRVKTLILGACFLVACGSSPLGASTDSAAGAGSGGTPVFVDMCSAARAQLIGAVDTVSSGEVTVLSVSGGVTTLYVNATAGGSNGAVSNPWTFISLDKASKVEVSDVSALRSKAWDLAFKRALIYGNDGDGGPGNAGGALLDKAFADVTRADATGVDFVDERFFDADCNPNVDLTGQVYTSFADWYEYDTATHVLTPAPGTLLVRGATGKLFKLQVQTYYATPSGGMGTAGGAYLLKLEAL